MRYEWNERTNRQNQRKHEGVSFELAALVFDDERCLVGLEWLAATGLTKAESSAGMRLGPYPLRRELARFCWWYMHTGRISMAKRLSGSSRPGGLTRMSTDDIRNRKWTETEKDAVRRAAALQAVEGDSGIDFSDIPKLTEEQLARMIQLRDVRRKVPVSVRLDAEVLEWLRSKGEGHLTRINDILTNLMEAERRAGMRK
jgi:uncharacterized protein (DUF4415 family)